jgi:hypothetical protein
VAVLVIDGLQVVEVDEEQGGLAVVAVAAAWSTEVGARTRRRSNKEIDPVPFVTNHWRRTGGLLAMAVGLVTLLSAGPASAATTSDATLIKTAAANPLGCVVNNALSKPLAGLGDFADYALAPGGNFESGAPGWLLTGGAAVVAGNETAYVGSRADRSSLALPSGSTATSATMCIDGTYPHFKVFARNTGSTKSTLKVEVLYMDGKGKIVGSGSGTIAATNTTWQLSKVLNIGVTFNTAVAAGAAPVAFRFTPSGSSAGNWQIDDVYVDPYARH